MLVLLILSIALAAGLLFGANLTSFAILIAGAVVALIFSLAAFITTRRTRRSEALL